MKTVRLDPVLESRLEQAAELEGISASALIRRALERETEAVLARRGSHRLAAFIGSVCSDEPTDASQIKSVYQEAILEKAKRWTER